MIDAASQLRFVRRRADLSQREVARRAGTSSATLSRYESGSLAPNVATYNRLIRACLPASRRWPSLAALAPVMAVALASQGSLAAWRLAAEVIDDENLGSASETALAIADVPARTGDSRVDSVIAALAEHLALRRQIAVPGWTEDSTRVARPWWFVAESPAWIPTSLRESPPSFARRGIFLTAGALERL
ncbi:MAG: helix-turn-helix domain-containing protein [Candidatus Dormiibacterota bacterium]